MSECFHILQDMNRKSEESEEQERDIWERPGYENLAALSHWMQEKNAPHWSEDGFDATRVATQLYRVAVPDSGEEEQ